jgi:phosphotransferase system enzyme I (PtsI)
MGLNQFSMHPASLLTVKQEILRADATRLAPRVARLLASDDPLRVRTMLARLAEPASPGAI